MDPIDKHVGSRLRIRRKELGLSQQQLADGMGITFQQIQKYERGTNRVASSRLHQLCQMLRVTPQYFFDISAAALDTERESIDLLELVERKEFMRLNMAYLRIESQALRDSILALIETAAAECDATRTG